MVFGVTDASTATLDLNGFSQTINTLSAANGQQFDDHQQQPGDLATLTISGGTTAKTGYNGTITGNLAMYKDGPGGLTLTGSSTYTGATTIAQGALTVSNTSALGVGPLSLQSGATLISSGARGEPCQQQRELWSPGFRCCPPAAPTVRWLSIT